MNRPPIRILLATLLLGAAGVPSASAAVTPFLTIEGDLDKAPNALSFTADGRSLMISRLDEVQLVDLASGRVHESVSFGSAEGWHAVATLSPDGRLLARVLKNYPNEKAQVEIVDLESDETLSVTEYDGTGSDTGLLRFTRDGNYLLFSPAYGKRASTVFVITTDSGRVSQLAPHRDCGHCPVEAIQANDGMLYVGGEDSVALMDAATGAELQRFASLGTNQGLAISGDGERLVVAKGRNDEYNDVARVLDTSTGEVLSEFVHPERWWLLRDVRFLDDRPVALFTLDGGGFVVVDLSNGTSILEVETEEEIGYFGGALSPTGERVAILRGDLSVEVYATVAAGASKPPSESAQLTTTEPTVALVPGLGHEGSVNDVVFSRDGSLLVTAGEDGHVWVWDVATSRAIRSILIPAGAEALALSSDSRLMAVADSHGDITVWELREGRELQSVSGASNPLAIAFLDGDEAILSCGSRRCRLLSLSRDLDTRLGAGARDFSWVAQFGDSARRASLSHDASILALSLGAKGMAAFDVDSGRLLWHVSAPGKQRVGPVAVTSDGTVVAGTDQGSLLVARADGPAKARVIELGKRGVGALAPLADGRVAAGVHGVDRLGGPDIPSVIHLVEVGAGQIERTLGWPVPPPDSEPSTAYLSGLAVGPRASVLVSTHQASLDGLPRVQGWDGSSGVPNRRFGGSVLKPISVAFGREDSKLIVSGKYGTALWDIPIGRVVRRFEQGWGSSVKSVGTALTFSKESSSDLVIWSAREGERTVSVPEEAVLALTSEPLVGAGRIVAKRGNSHVSIVEGAGTPGSALSVRHVGDESWLLDDSHVALTPDGRHLALRASARGARLVVTLVDLETGEFVWQSKTDELVDDLAFDPTGEVLVSTHDFGAGLSVHRTAGGALRDSRRGEDTVDVASRLVRHPNDTAWILETRRSSEEAILIDPADGAELDRVRLGGVDAQGGHARVDSSGQIVLVASTQARRSLLWNRAKDERHWLPTRVTGPDAIGFSSDGRWVAIADADGSVGLWSVVDGTLLVRLVALRESGWAVIGDDGRYDASDPGDFPELSWRVSDELHRPLPVEVFYKERFEPRLLPRVLGGEQFSSLPPPTDLDRAQAAVRFSAVTVTPTGGLAFEVSATPTGPSGLGELKVFRDGSLVGRGPSPVRLDNVPVPGGAESVELSAHAFNGDGIKSETVRHRQELTKPTAVVQRKAHVIAIGVNTHRNPSWDLRHAVDDARATAAALSLRLEASGEFAEVVTIELLADGTGEATATRAKVEAVLSRLAGGEPSVLLGEIPGAAGLTPASVDDVVLLSFSGHGLASSQGDFHFFLSDIAEGVERRVDDALLRSTLSSQTLSTLLEKLAPTEIVLIIDACNSAASVEGKGFKPGPMGSRGLGQLAYDKGMRILAGSQAEASAIESERLRHGLLTYSLVREGLEGAEADRAPLDGLITMAELLTHGVERVPALHDELSRTGAVSLAGRGWTLDSAPELRLGAQGETSPYAQRPSLFDFRKGPRSALVLPAQLSAN